MAQRGINGAGTTRLHSEPEIGTHHEYAIYDLIDARTVIGVLTPAVLQQRPHLVSHRVLNIIVCALWTDALCNTDDDPTRLSDLIIRHEARQDLSKCA